MNLSIILTVYNKANYLCRALDSIFSQLEQANCNYEVIAVNDGSTDNSADILEEYSRKENRLKIIIQDNKGLSMARNIGLDAAKGNYVWFVDADDAISPNAIKYLYQAMDFYPDIIPVYAETNGGVGKNIIKPSSKTGKEILIERKWSQCTQFWVIRRDFLLNSGLRFFPGIFHEDAEFTPRMLYYAKSVRVVPRVLYTTYEVPNSITRTLIPKRAYDCLTIAEQISDFIESTGEIGTPVGKSLVHNASVTINCGFLVIIETSKEEQRHFNEIFHRKKKLISLLSTSPSIKHRVEAIFFRLFSGYYVELYRLMKLFSKPLIG